MGPQLCVEAADITASLCMKQSTCYLSFITEGDVDSEVSVQQQTTPTVYNWSMTTAVSMLPIQFLDPANAGSLSPTSTSTSCILRRDGTPAVGEEFSFAELAAQEHKDCAVL